MKEWIVVDIDGTLSDCNARVDYAKVGLWAEFHSRCFDDPPFTDVLELIHRLGPHMSVLVATGRNEIYRHTTLRWFKEHGVMADVLLMRPDDDYRPDNELKLAMIEGYFGSKEATLDRIAFCLDDRDKVVEAYRNYGLPCWQVREGTF